MLVEIDLDRLGIAGVGVRDRTRGPDDGRIASTSSCSAGGGRSRPDSAMVSPIDREIAGGGPIFGRHVGDHRPVARRERRDARTEIFDELAGDALPAQPVGDGQGKIGGEHAFLQRAGKPHADHLRHPQHHRHAEHDALGLQPADAPAQHADAVDHRSVAVGADQRVGDSGATPFSSQIVTTVASCSRLMVCMIPVPGGWTVMLRKLPAAHFISR